VVKIRLMEEPEDFYKPDPIRENSLERSLPNSSEAEKAVLGAIILNNVFVFQAIELLTPEDFYVPSHRKIFAAMTRLFERGDDIDPIFIGEELKRNNELEIVGGFSFITNLTYGLPHSTTIEHYATVILGKSRLRILIKTAKKITNEALEEEEEPDTILGHAEHAIFQLTETRYKTKLEAIDSTLVEVISAAHDNVGHGLTVTGLSTGLTDIDQLTAGLQKSDLIILAARPGVGKTACACTIINNITIRNPEPKRVAFFSLEMSRWAIITRMLCSEARVDFKNRFSKGFMNHEEWDAIGQASERLQVQRIFLDDKPAISVLEIRAKVMRMTLQIAKPDLIVVDYVQLMTGVKEHRKESRQQEVSGISRELKSLAKEMDRPVLALCQLNRALEGLSDKRPQLHHLRESGSLEQDADLVAFLYREMPKYNQGEQPTEPQNNITEFIIAKQRNGPCDTVPLRFDGPSMRFDSLHQD
jgi:replicative DNA helicase